MQTNTVKNNPLSVSASLILGFAFIIGLVGCSGGGSAPAPVPASPTITVNSPSVAEGQAGTAEMIFTVTLSENAASALTMDYTTVDGTATTADGDYTAVTGSLMIPAGSSTANVSVFANGDTTFEQNETITLMLSNPQGLVIATSPINGQGTITNDDNAVPRGYFAGTASVNATTLTDMTGMMHNNRLMMFNPGANVLYDITFSAITLNDFTATADVYVDGAISQTSVSLAGTTDESLISGTFTGGTGFADGSFSITFDVNNNIGATLARIEALSFDWFTGTIYGMDVDSDSRFSSDATGDYSVVDFTTPRCVSSNSLLVIPDNQVNIYALAHNVNENVSCGYISTGHTGFASVLSISSVNTLVFAYANGAISVFGVMTK